MREVTARAATAAVAGAVALTGAGLVATPAVRRLAQIAQIEVRLAAELQDITLDFVRHGQSAATDNDLSTVAPGAGLSDLGQQQADAVAPVIQNEFPDGIAGIYASGLLRAQETAAPLAQLLGMDVTDLSGLNAVNGGVFEGMPKGGLEALLNGAAPLAWMLGQYWFPALGSSDYNGMAFESRFDDAVQTMYDNTVGTDSTGPLTDVAFSHEGAISVWTLMNVKNPDFGLVVEHLINTGGLLSHTGQVVVEGNPTDGWTLISWDGQDVPQDPGLLTDLFVDVRDLMTVPQMALFQLQEAVLDVLGGDDPTVLLTALETGLTDIGQELVAFPQAVIGDLMGAL